MSASPATMKFVDLFHTTSPGAACSIIRSGQFKAITGMSADHGLNALAEPLRSHQQFAGYGARLKLRWSGPVRQTQRMDLQNVLVDQLPHRLFVPAGTTQYLSVTEIEMHDQGWEEAAEQLDPLPFWARLPGIMSTVLRRREAGLRLEIQALLAGSRPIIVC